jgi:hypothetical protein
VVEEEVANSIANSVETVTAVTAVTAAAEPPSPPADRAARRTPDCTAERAPSPGHRRFISGNEQVLCDGGGDAGGDAEAEAAGREGVAQQLVEEDLEEVLVEEEQVLTICAGTWPASRLGCCDDLAVDRCCR